jgi:hypothetical protein
LRPGDSLPYFPADALDPYASASTVDLNFYTSGNQLQTTGASHDKTYTWSTAADGNSAPGWVSN